jgi:predicted transcriptional regulator
VSERNTKQRVLEAIRDLPENVTVEDAMERLYFLAKIEEGESQADAGRTMSHEEARRRILG